MFKHRDSEGFYEILINRHLKNNNIKFLENQLVLQPTNRIKKPITPAEKLAVTLRYLATGESIRSFSFSFRISHCYLSSIIKNTLAALKIKLMPIFMSDIKNIDFKQKAAEFSYKWNFPNCILAIDGKHVRIRSPSNSGSLFHNYKDYFSIVLLAMVDANYKFVAVDIGSFGKEGDSGIFLKSNMGKQILNGTFKFPEHCNLLGSDKVAPHLAAYIICYVKVTWKKNKRPFFDLNSEEPPPINNMMPLSRRGGFSNMEGFEVREVFKTFFNDEGALSWQPNF
ncbi:unnamed protein product [Macrosiphum euphorbiae]|uniref:DDE Tnp4 domain-containing protein n=1 Tax=Macrosiphum euphorbiae TaxID=13131 RepID=A0AAV0XZ99_9HEMI|nr:unnamed protein product [Macrosiphum euphorbiae]